MLVSLLCDLPATRPAYRMAAFRGLYRAEALSSLHHRRCSTAVHSFAQFETDAALASVYFKGHAVPMPCAKRVASMEPSAPFLNSARKRVASSTVTLPMAALSWALALRPVIFSTMGRSLIGLAHSNYLIKSPTRNRADLLNGRPDHPGSRTGNFLISLHTSGKSDYNKILQVEAAEMINCSSLPSSISFLPAVLRGQR